MSLDEVMPWGEMSEPIPTFLLVLLLYMQIQYRENGNSGRHATASLAMHTEWSYLPRKAAHCPFFLLLPS